MIIRGAGHSWFSLGYGEELFSKEFTLAGCGNESESESESENMRSEESLFCNNH